MKKTLLISALLISGLANAAGVSKVTTLPAQINYELKLERTKNNVVEVLNDYKISTLVGFPSPVGNYKNVTYIKSASTDPITKKVILTPETIAFGLNTNLTFTEGKTKGSYQVNFVNSYSELLNMVKTTSGEAEVDLPTTKEWSSTSSVVAKLNEQIVLGDFGYTEHNHILHKDEEVKYRILLKVIPQ